MAVTSQTRFKELDALRGFAALWVVFYHFLVTQGLLAKQGLAFITTPDPFGQTHVWPSGVINLQGIRAVDLFFVISGFVIFMTVKNIGTVLDFIAARVARLFPAYLFSVALAGLLILALPVRQEHISWSQFVVNLTMLEEYSRVKPINDVYWSLSYELEFYFCIVLLLTSRLIKNIEAVGLAWLAAAFLAVRLLPMFGHELPWRVETAFVLPYAALFFSGIVWYLIWSDRFTWARGALIAISYVDMLRLAPCKPG